MLETSEVAHFSIQHTVILDNDGRPVQPLPEFAKDKSFVIKLYRTMVQTRLFDKKAITLQRTGKLGTYPPTLGQEAVSVGFGSAMEHRDILCPYYRETGAQLWRGVTMQEMLLFWGGDERGSNYAATPEDLPLCIPIGTQCLHGAGVAAAFKIRKERRAALVSLGDGATSRGDFYEAMNVAGAWHLPLVFVINNNHWAISVPLEHQSATQTLAQKGIAGGLACTQVDGNDVLAVYGVTLAALERAKAGKGATLIEAITYRMGDHTTADDASRYRAKEMTDKHKKEDPINRLRSYMVHQGWWNESQESELYHEMQTEIDKAVELYLLTPRENPGTIFEYLYATLPEAYLDQYQEVIDVHNTR